MLRRFAAATLILLATAGTAVAQTETAERVVTLDAWSVYVAQSANGRVCFAVSQPQNTAPTGVNRGAIYFMLSSWPALNIRNEAYVIIGYPFAEESTVTVTIDNDETFQFFTVDERAWLIDIERGNELVVAMQRGLEMVVRGRSARGTDTTDTYSLRGVTAAINRAQQECPG